VESYSVISNGQPGNATTWNTGFVSRIADDNTTGKKDLQNTDPASGADVINIQREINSHNAYSGRPSGSAHNATPVWSNTEVGTGTDTLKQRAEALTLEFNTTSGHTHDGTDSRLISATDLQDINQFVSAYQSVEKSAASGTSIDVSTEFTGLVNGGGAAALGVLTTAPDNKVQLIATDTGTVIEDAGGQKVYGRLTWAASVWTLSFYTNEAGVETAHSLASTDITIFYREVFNLATRPTIPADIGEIGSLDLTADVVDASPTQRGVVSTGVQSFAGAKTFTGAISASNLSGTNTGDVTLAAIGATPNANGGSLSGQVLNLQPADASFGGVVSTGAQSFAGDKTFVDFIEAQSELFGAIETDAASTGSAQTLPTPAKTIYRVTNGSLASVQSITAPSKAQLIILVNAKGSALDLIDATGNILTGTAEDLTVSDGASVWLAYDTVTTKWRVVGGSGSGGGGAFTTQAFTGTTITTTADGFQKWRYTGGSAQTLASIDSTLIPDGGVLTIIGTSATNILTVYLGYMPSPARLGLGDSVSLQRDATLGQYSEVGRTQAKGQYYRNMTGNTMTVFKVMNEKIRYTGVSAQTMSAITNTGVQEGQRLAFLGTDDTNTLTFENNDVSNGWLISGTWVGYKGSMLIIEWDETLTRWVEVSRNA
jgi:hypothetical protein